MKNQWFRLYVDFATNPKIQTMPEAMQRRYVMLLCMKSNGDLPCFNDVSVMFQLRLGEKRIKKTKDLFLSKNLITEDWDIVGWDKCQFKSDTSTDRVKKFRDKRNVSETLQKRRGNVTVTPSEQKQNRNRTETEQIRPDKESDATGKAVDEIDNELAKTFLKAVRKRKPTKTPNMAKWADDFRKMRTLDSITVEDLKLAIQFLDESEPTTDGFCWGDVVLSPAKLRKQMQGSLYPAIQRKARKKPSIGQMSESEQVAAYGTIDENWREQLFGEEEAKKMREEEDRANRGTK